MYYLQEMQATTLIFMNRTAIQNCRGIGNYSTRSWLKNVISKDHIQYIRIIEPIIYYTRAKKLCKELSMEFVWTNPTNKIWLFGKGSEAITHIDDFKQCSTFATSTSESRFYISITYASYENSYKKSCGSILLIQIMEKTIPRSLEGTLTPSKVIWRKLGAHRWHPTSWKISTTTYPRLALLSPHMLKTI